MKQIKLLILFILCWGGLNQQASAQCTASFSSSNYQYSGYFQSNGSSASNYYWNFGDGSPTVNGNSTVMHNYSNAGWYAVCLTIADSIGSCQNTFCDSVYIAGCNVTGTFFDSVSNGNSITFHGNASGGVAPYGYHWYFGDGSFGSSNDTYGPGVTHTTHTYPGPGTYNVNMVVYDSVGCADTITNTITVGNNAPCNLSAWAIDSLVSGSTYNFYGGAASGTPGYPFIFRWDYGDGTPLTYGAYTTHTYANAGTYNYTLYVTDTFTMCEDTINQTLVVGGSSNPCANLSGSFTYTNPFTTLVNFSGNVTGGVAPYSYWWSFGDGSYGNGQNTNHAYNQPGTYTVWMAYSDSLGCIDTVYQAITVGNPCNLSVSLFDSIVNGNNITFQGNVFGGTAGTQYDYFWNFGDGAISNTYSSYNSSNSVSHTYNNPGLYNVCLTVVDSLSGCQETYCDSILVGGSSNPCANLSGSFTYTNPFTTLVNFSGNVTGGTAPYSYWWSFGDGNYGNGQNTNHAYNQPGTYTVWMAYSDSLGCIDTVYQTVTVGNPCNLSVSLFDSIVNGNNITFQGNVFGGTAGTQYDYFWNFGDGAISNTYSSYNSSNSVSHTYNNPGLYNVCLTVFDSLSGCQDTYCDSIWVNGTVGNNCNVTGSFFDSLYNNTSASFYGYATGGTAPYTYYWDFGDNSNATTYDYNGQTGFTISNHTYNSPGTYTVAMYVFDSLGCGDTIYNVISVAGSNPCSGYSVSLFDSIVNGNNITFQGNVFGGTAGTQYDYFWNFGDGATSNTYGSYNSYNSVSHTYNNPGLYNVCLTVFDSLSGCQETYCDSVFISIPSQPCTQNRVALYLQLDNFASETTWDITDNAGNIIVSSGSYNFMNNMLIDDTLCLPTGCYNFNIYDSYGDGICCLYGQGHYALRDVSTGQILANGGAFAYQESTNICVGGAVNPCSNFNTAITSNTNGNVVNFVSTTTGSNGGNVYAWDFGDGNTSTLQNPVHTYTSSPANNFYNVCLTVSDSLGCTTTTCDSVFVQPAPCAQNAVTLTLNLDNFASETSWTLTNANGAVVYSGNNYTANGSTVIENFCLPTGCYDFNIYDTWGDGICCAWGQGNYMLTDTNGGILARGGSFGNSESTNICVGGATNPCANFSASYTYSVNPNGTAQFTSQIQGGQAPYTYQWTFNNATSTLANPSNNYGGNGAYYAGLTVTDVAGCTYTYWDTVLITNSSANTCATARLSLDIMQDSSNPYLIWMQPIITNAPLNSQYDFSWSFGDGTGTMGGFPIHQYTNWGTYIVCVVAVDSINGCALTICDTITIDSVGNFSRTPDYKDVKPGFMVNVQQPSITYVTSTTKIAAVQNVKLYPNPTANNLTVDLESNVQEEVQLTVLNMQGQIVLERTNAIETGQDLMSLQVNHLASGAYIIRLVGNQTQETLQFIKE